MEIYSIAKGNPTSVIRNLAPVILSEAQRSEGSILILIDFPAFCLSPPSAFPSQATADRLKMDPSLRSG